MSTLSVFKEGNDHATVIQILQDQQLKSHVTQVPAFLLCVEGNVVFENEKGIQETLTNGEYVFIEPLVKHWVNGIVDSQLLLLK